MSNTTDFDEAWVEAVARAVCQSRSCEGINCCQWPANRGRYKCPVKDGGYDDAARAALSLIVPLVTARERERIYSVLQTSRKALAILRSMCLTAGLKLGAAKADEIMGWIFDASNNKERFPDPPYDALRRDAAIREGSIEHRPDCQLKTVGTFGLCTCDFDQRMSAIREGEG